MFAVLMLVQRTVDHSNLVVMSFDLDSRLMLVSNSPGDSQVDADVLAVESVDLSE